MRISQRLALGFGVVLALFAAGTLVAFRYSVHSAELERRQDDVIEPSLDAARALHRAYLEEAVQLRRLALTGNEDAQTRFAAGVALARSSIEILRNLPEDAERAAFLADLMPRNDAIEAAATTFLAAVADGDPAAIAAREQALSDAREDATARVEAFADRQAQLLLDASHAKADARRQMLRAFLLLGVIVLAGGGVAAFTTARTIHRRTTRLADATRDLERGDHDAALAALARDADGSSNDELVTIGRGFAAMTRALRDREWRVTAHAAISARLASTIEVDELAAGLLETLAEQLPCELGAVYLAGAPGAPGAPLRRVAGWGAARGPASLAAGDGIPGEAVARRRTIVVRSPDDAGFPIETGFATLAPRTLLAAPLICGDAVGVLVIGALRELPDDAIELAEDAARLAGVSLNSALGHREVRRLAADLETHNDQLQAQNEEIQTQNEEIQAQNEEIQAQHEEVEHQKAELQEADRQKQELISIASHELRSPLSSLKLQAEVLAHDLRDPAALDPVRRDQHVSRMTRTIDRLATRVDRLLDYSRAQMGRLHLAPEPVDLVALAREVVEAPRPDAGDRRVTFATDVASATLPLDRSYLDQAIGNLLENALRYSPEGGEVAVRVTRAGGEVLIAVADHGIGIAPERLERLFEPYTRDDDAVRVSAEGMGLGLYITRAIVRAHGGRIWAESEVGCGTTFTIALPAPGGRTAAPDA